MNTKKYLMIVIGTLLLAATASPARAAGNDGARLVDPYGAVEAYNNLAKALNERLEIIGKPPIQMKTNDGKTAITQLDLSSLRSSAEGLDGFFNKGDMNLSSAECAVAFPRPSTKLNGGKGYTVVPAAYTSKGGIYTKAPSYDNFANVPLLSIHFTEIALVINKCTARYQTETKCNIIEITEGEGYAYGTIGEGLVYQAINFMIRTKRCVYS